MTESKRKRGKPALKPTDEDRKFVTLMAIAGITKETIARVMGMDKKTLNKHFEKALDESVHMAHAKIVGALYNNALKGNVAAQIFYCKTRLGWQEVDRHEHSGPGGASLQAILQVVKK